MRGITVAVILALAAAGLQAETQIDELLNRVSEEAEAFRVVAPKLVAKETLRQKARKKASRFRLRAGEDARKPPPVTFQTREIISEYGFTTFEESPEALHELRQVVSVDGREVVDHEKARETLTLSLTGADNRLKKKLLTRFQKHGLHTAATDFGQMLLLFRRSSLQRYEFSIEREAYLGADTAIVLRYRQREGPEALTIFEGRTAAQERLEGELWVRKPDGVPLRVTMKITVKDKKITTVHEGIVDYFSSSFGSVLPASVSYRQTINGDLLVEIVSNYSDFHFFAVETEVKFKPADPEPE